MRRVAIGVLLTCLLGAGDGSALAQEPSPDRAADGQRLELPGYGVSIRVPDDWMVEIGGPSGLPLRPDSPYAVAFYAIAGSGGQWCILSAYSRLGCTVPVDLEAELVEPGWDRIQLPAGNAAYRQEGLDEGAVCTRNLLTDGVDIF